MFYRIALTAAFVGFIAFGPAPAPASAQVQSEGMGDLSAWGTRYLSSDEKEFPPQLWRGSDDEVLLDLLKTVRTTRLTPAERKLLRRVVLSPVERPRGENAEALLTERARLMLELGEARAAAALAPRLESQARGLDVETIAVDLDMASGRENAACRRIQGGLPEGEYWLKLRVVCAILVENYAAAELAAEFATAQGVNDPWFLEAVFAGSGEVPNPPYARFDSGLNIALSSKANLDTSRITLFAGRPDLAAAAAQRPGIAPELSARFAQIAGDLDLISPQVRREILLKRIAADENGAASALERALIAQSDPEINAEEKARRIRSVMSSVSRADMARFGGTAKVLLPDLQRLQRSPETAQYALTFAKAAMAAGDNTLARRWLSALDIEGAPDANEFDIAYIEALDLMSGGDDSSASQNAIQKRLIDTAKSTDQKQKTAQILTLWSGFGYRLGADARSLVVSVNNTQTRVAPGALVAIRSAAASNASGETALLILQQLKGDPKQISSIDIADIAAALIQIDARDIAEDLALEATEFWKD
jgi:hypothetical protein